MNLSLSELMTWETKLRCMATTEQILKSSVFLLFVMWSYHSCDMIQGAFFDPNDYQKSFTITREDLVTASRVLLSNEDFHIYTVSELE